MTSTTLPTPPEGFDYLSFVVPIRVDRPMTETEREGLRYATGDAAVRAAEARVSGGRA